MHSRMLFFRRLHPISWYTWKGMSASSRRKFCWWSLCRRPLIVIHVRWSSACRWPVRAVWILKTCAVRSVCCMFCMWMYQERWASWGVWVWRRLSLHQLSYHVMDGLGLSNCLGAFSYHSKHFCDHISSGSLLHLHRTIIHTPSLPVSATNHQIGPRWLSEWLWVVCTKHVGQF